MGHTSDDLMTGTLSSALTRDETLECNIVLAYYAGEASWWMTTETREAKSS